MDTVSEILWLLRMTINIQRIDKVQQFCSTSHDPLQCIVTNSYFHGVEVENCRIYRWCSRQMFWFEYIKTTRSIRFNVHLLLFSLYCLKPEKYIFTKYLNKKMLFWCKKNCLPLWKITWIEYTGKRRSTYRNYKISKILQMYIIFFY